MISVGDILAGILFPGVGTRMEDCTALYNSSSFSAHSDPFVKTLQCFQNLSTITAEQIALRYLK